MQNIGLLIRLVRESHGISQAEIAEKAGISQSAVTQFENLKASLSLETIFKMAPFLNLNPDYVEKGIGNPFRQRSREEIIKMFLPETPLGEIDFSLLKLIAEKNRRAVFLFLKTISDITIKYNYEERDIIKKERAQWRKQVNQGFSIFALLVQDDDDNIFIFKRKNNLFFNEESLISFIKEEQLKEKKLLEINTIGMKYSVYKEIRDWKTIGDATINDLLKNKYFNDRVFLIRLINEMWNRQTLTTDRDSYENIKHKVNNMAPEELSSLLMNLMPRFANILKEII